MATYYSNWVLSEKSTPNGEKYVVDGKEVTYYNDVRFKYITSEITNAINNTSKITIKKYAILYYTWPDPGNLDIVPTVKTKIGNQDYQSDQTVCLPTSNINNYVFVGTDTFTVKHNLDGTGLTTFTASGEYAGGSGTIYGSTFVRNITLISINRGSTVTSNATENTKFGDTIKFTIKKIVDNADYVHELRYKMYDASGVLTLNTTDEFEWQIPMNLIYSTPNNADPIISIECITRLDSRYVGTNYYSFNCKVPLEYKPSCSLEIEEVGDVPKSWGIFVESKSKIKGVITANKYDQNDEKVTINNYFTNTGVNVYTSNPFQTGYIVNDGSYEIKSQVTDSRGRSSEYNENNSLLIKVLPYTVPTIKNIIIQRCNSLGEADENGTYAKATMDFEIASLNDKNEKKLSVSFGDQKEEIIPSEYSGSHTFDTIFSGFETEKSYIFTFAISDYFSKNIQQTAELLPSFITKSNLNGGKGITYGRLATEEGIHNYMDVENHTNTKVKNININGLKIEKYGNSYIAFME